MATRRQVQAYQRRLAKIDSGTRLTAECLNAVVTFLTLRGADEVTGTLVSYTHRLGFGLLGPRVVTDVRICTECIDQNGDCPDVATLPVHEDIALLSIRRNSGEQP